MKVDFNLNGSTHSAQTAVGTTLLEYLREQGFFSVKHGCDKGNCGSCTVLIEGKAHNACLVLVASCAGRQVETLEHFNREQGLNSLQEAFLQAGAIQCGYCTPAMLLALEALYRNCPAPTETEIRDALSGVLCRCTGYAKPVEAALNLRSRENSSE